MLIYLYSDEKTYQVFLLKGLSISSYFKVKQQEICFINPEIVNEYLFCFWLCPWEEPMDLSV